MFLWFYCCIGERGDGGDKGDIGIKGDSGEAGQKGDTGDIGYKGEKGLPGQPGPRVSENHTFIIPLMIFLYFVYTFLKHRFVLSCKKQFF